MRTEGEEVIDDTIDSGLMYMLDMCYDVNRSLIKDLFFVECDPSAVPRGSEPSPPRISQLTS